MLLIVFLIMSSPIVIRGQISNNTEALLNWCLDARHHKSKPGPEDLLYSQCSPWKKRACCTSNTTQNLHYNNLYKFNYDHCSHKRNMSNACRRHFLQDECFYECSPNIGPWVVKVQMKIRNERFYDVPLCASDCEAWFQACKDDFTCRDNWMHNRVTEGKITPCFPDDKCSTFAEIYGTSENFCQKVWDHSWKYTADSQPCMRLWFNGSQGNPNDAVTRYYVLMRLGNGAIFNTHIDNSVLFISLLFAVLQIEI